MQENNKWSEINEEEKKIVQNIKQKSEFESSVDDLKNSLKISLDKTGKIFKDLFKIIESSINDEEIKNDSKNLINNIVEELDSLTNQLSEKIAIKGEWNQEEE